MQPGGGHTAPCDGSRPGTQPLGCRRPEASRLKREILLAILWGRMGNGGHFPVSPSAQGLVLLCAHIYFTGKTETTPTELNLRARLLRIWGLWSMWLRPPSRMWGNAYKAFQTTTGWVSRRHCRIGTAGPTRQVHPPILREPQQVPKSRLQRQVR